MMIADRGGHTQTSPGASDKLDELTEDRKLYKRVHELLAEVGNTMLDCTPPESYAYPAELNYGINKCNNSNAELFYSIHFNSTYGAYGSEVCIYPGTDLTSKVGNKILKNLYDLGFRNRGLKPRTDLGELCNINCSSMIIEVCFVHEKDAAIYKSIGVERIARAIANGIDSRVNLKVSKQESEANEIKEEKKVDYIIQYSNPVDQNIAEVMADRLNCPTINCLRPYAYYGQYKTVIAVGEAKNKSGHTNVFIQGSNRQDTLDKAIDYCKSLGR